jgi:hypothetical protein
MGFVMLIAEFFGEFFGEFFVPPSFVRPSSFVLRPSFP